MPFSEVDENRAKSYSLIKYSLDFSNTLFTALCLFLFSYFSFSKNIEHWLSSYIASESILFIPTYLLLLLFLYYVFNFPFNIYQSFILERQFCLSRQSLKDWFIDQFKTGVISYSIVLIILEAFYFILRNNPQDWWVIISIFMVFFSFILARIVPTLIVPLFFKYQKLPDSILRNRIMNLADKMHTKILNCFQIDLSRKTTKANAALLGWGASKRIVLADTLKDKYTYDEIEVIIAHELAHYKLRHLIKLLLVSSLVSFACFYIIFITNSNTLTFFKLGSLSSPAAIPLIALYFLLFGLLTQPIENYISRRMEANADKMAISVTGMHQAFISMMEKLAIQNLADVSVNPLIKLFYFNHPPINERIALAKEMLRNL